jgi:phage-related holin
MSHRLLPFMDDIWSFLKLLFISVLMYLSPVKNFVHLVSALIIIDLMTGILASWKSGKKITASRMAKTIYKLILYSVAIIATYLVQMIAADGVGLVRICALIIGATELKSIYENISRITGGDLFRMIWEVIKSKIDEITSAMPSKSNVKSDQNEQVD